MRRLLTVVFLALGLVAVDARPASAQGFWRWLESLSGPGPSHGWGLEVPLLCTGVRTLPEATGVRLLGCGQRGPTPVPVTVGLSASFLRGDNTLDYAPGTPADRIDRVSISTVTGFVDVGIHPAFDVGFGAGLMRIGDLPVASFTRLVLQPIRVAWKPLAMSRTGDARRDYRREFLVIRFDATLIPGGLVAEDFGAVPGTFKTPPGEIIGSYLVLINVLPLLGK
jgi:hypothetical protein